MSELVPSKQKMLTIRDMFESRRNEIAKAIPRGLDPVRFVRVAMTTIGNSPKLLACTPASLMSCMLQATQWGLELDPVLGQAYLVPYKDRCTLIIGYRGLLEMARRHESIESITARLVYEGDELRVEYGLHPILKHVPDMTASRGQIIGAYCVWRLKGATEPEFVYMRRDEIEAIRKRSRASNDGPWITDYDMMALKTVLRRASRFWPQSTDLGLAVASDERQELGIDVEPLDLAEAPPALEEKKLVDALPPVPEATDQDIDAEIVARETVGATNAKPVRKG